MKPSSGILVLFDTVYLFKMFNNNFIRKETFTYPSFSDNDDEKVLAKFTHLQEPYHLELGKWEKMAFNLTHTGLIPINIEKTNVRLAILCSMSTISAVEYCGNHGYAHFKGTAKILIRD